MREARRWARADREDGEHVSEGVIDVGMAVVSAGVGAGREQLETGQAALDGARGQPDLRLSQAHARLQQHTILPCHDAYETVSQCMIH